MSDKTEKPKEEVNKTASEEIAPPDKSLLVEHAEREMRRVGLFDEDADYGGAMAQAVMELVETFASQHHSGASADLTLTIFSQVVKWDLLSEPTDDPDEWEDKSDISFTKEQIKAGHRIWMNKRSGHYISYDKGKHWKRTDNDKQGTSRPKDQPIKQEKSSDGSTSKTEKGREGGSKKVQPDAGE